MQKAESQEHKNLVQELALKLKADGFRIDAVDDPNGECPKVVENKHKVGDGENKMPDIDAFDVSSKRMIRGEAKVGNGDIESEHSITQYILFSDRSLENVSSYLYIIVPASKKSELNQVIINNVPKTSWDNIKLISSSRQ